MLHLNARDSMTHATRDAGASKEFLINYFNVNIFSLEIYRLLICASWNIASKYGSLNILEREISEARPKM